MLLVNASDNWQTRSPAVNNIVSISKSTQRPFSTVTPAERPRLSDLLKRSLERQKRVFDASVVLTPADSVPHLYEGDDFSSFLQGMYISDKRRDTLQKQASKIQFGGRDHATDDLQQIHRAFAQSLGAAECSLRLLSGLHAHIVTFMSLASIGDSVLLLPEIAGGHFATKKILERLGLRVFEMPVDMDHFRVDIDATLKIVRRERPTFIFVDRSEGLRFEDFRFLGDLEGPIKIFDGSQYLAQILAGLYINPLSYGFDLMLFTLHKSFPGPQKAGIASARSDSVWQTLVKGLGEYVSSSHPDNSYKAAMVLSKQEELAAYASRLLETSLSIERSLRQERVPVFDRGRQGASNWPATQHLWIPLGSDSEAFTSFKALASVRVQTNYRLLPYNLGWGLRLGTNVLAMTSLGTNEIAELANIVSLALREGPCLRLRHRVRDLALCLSARRAKLQIPVLRDEEPLGA